jgi:DNA end-binding protein Ku
MAVRPAWRGYLKLSLVTCAVELFNATTHTEKPTFRILNRKTQHAVRRQYVDAQTGKALDDEDQVKGYEIGKDKFLLFEEDEIERLAIESSHTLNLEGFVKKAEIEAIYLDTPYYVAPADDVSVEAFAVIRDALARKEMAGMARIVLFRRERPVVIEPMGKGMLLTTLRFDKLVRRPDQVLGDIDKVKTDSEMFRLALRIVDKKMMKFDPAKFADKYEDAIFQLIKAKKAGKKAPAMRPAAKPGNIVDLFDALKKSLSGRDGANDNAEKAGKRKAGPRRKSAAAKKSRSRSSSRKSA